MTVEASEFFDRAQQIALDYLSRVNAGAPIDHRFLDEADAYRFFQSVRGGASIIVARDGTFLFANSNVPPAKHEEAFVAGRRTAPEMFEKPPDSPLP